MFVDFFIRRPVFATVCAILITLVGAISIPTLPVAQYPSLGLPQVTVTSFYTGASAEIVESAVTTPLELAISGVPGMKHIDRSRTSVVLQVLRAMHSAPTRLTLCLLRRTVSAGAHSLR